jgi:C-terminal processing protease CtpA/Prc
MIFAGCKKDKVNPDYPAGSNENINSWVLDSMQVYYYWSSSLPKRPDLRQEPLDFFTSIKNSTDRFSILVNRTKPLTYHPSLTTSFGVDLVSIEKDGNLQTHVILIVPGSGAALNGIKRGDRVSAINNVEITKENAEALVIEAVANGRLTLKMDGSQTSINLTATYPIENPIHTYKIFESGAVKTAYLFLNSFRSNTVNQLKSVFNGFIAANATELIIDLRYNGGGEVSVAALLATLIAPVKGTDIFAEYRGNAQAGSKRHSFDKELSYIAYRTDQLTAYRLPLRRVYILTGRHTASSAELLTNNLAPYIEVIQIGEQTLGKDMASFEIKDARNPVKVENWIIHPLVYKLYNARGKGDYAQGLFPSVQVNELQMLPLQPLGDETDALIASALKAISGKQARTSKIMSDVKVMMDTRNNTDAQSRVDYLNR